MDHQDQKLWSLLARAPRPTAPPFFAGKVLRQITAPAVPSRLSMVLRWLAPATVAALVLLAVIPRDHPEAATTELTTLDLVEMLSPEDYQVLTEAGWPYNNGLLSASL
jgi:hypothetical protein